MPWERWFVPSAVDSKQFDGARVRLNRYITKKEMNFLRRDIRLAVAERLVVVGGGPTATIQLTWGTPD